MIERPILFSALMVRALLAGTKTQTRRVLKRQPPDGTVFVGTYHHPDPRDHFYALVPNPDKTSPMKNTISQWPPMPCPYGQKGDRLWVRETFRDARTAAMGRVLYRADGDVCCGWKPSIFMPRECSRITLEITGVRVERLNGISEADALAEGITAGSGPFKGCFFASGQILSGLTAKECYRHLWDQINGPGAWNLNPWVWVVEFERVTHA